MQTNTTAAPKDDTFIQGVKDCIPTLLGYLSIGFAAGVVEKTAGLSLAEIALLSLLLYAGSAQFIFAGMITASYSVTAMIFTIFFCESPPYFAKRGLIALFSTSLSDEKYWDRFPVNR